MAVISPLCELSPVAGQWGTCVATEAARYQRPLLFAIAEA